MIEQHYTQILDKSRGALTTLVSDPERLKAFTSAHNDAQELDEIALLVVARPEREILDLALVEYQHALYAAAIAQYRQAHVSLRLFLELALCSVLFSAHEIDTHRWLKGKKDSNWASIICNENGVFSKQFIGAFFASMKDNGGQYRTLAATLYRECSEYVHGNRISYDGLDAEISFNSAAFDLWADRADTARLVTKFAFLCRFLSHSSKLQRDKIEALAMGNFGDLPAIQAIFEDGSK